MAIKDGEHVDDAIEKIKSLASDGTEKEHELNPASSVITSWNKKFTAPTYYGYFKYQYYDMGSLQTITSSTSSF